MGNKVGAEMEVWIIAKFTNVKHYWSKGSPEEHYLGAIKVGRTIAIISMTKHLESSCAF